MLVLCSFSSESVCLLFSIYKYLINFLWWWNKIWLKCLPICCCRPFPLPSYLCNLKFDVSGKSAAFLRSQKNVLTLITQWETRKGFMKRLNRESEAVGSTDDEPLFSHHLWWIKCCNPDCISWVRKCSQDIISSPRKCNMGEESCGGF